MYKSLGFRVKTSHSLRVTCATTLFQRGIDEKLIEEERVTVQMRYWLMKEQ